MKSSDYHAFTQRLTDNLKREAQVIGLVLLGSTANKSHAPDEWSDHDFFIITKSDVQEAFRTRFDWLPQSDHIVITVRETEHGLKVLYDDGHLLEYAVFDLEEIRLAKVNDYAIAFDRGGIVEAIEQIVQSDIPTSRPLADVQRDMKLFPCLLVVGAGRVARGEVISGQVFIRTYALANLLSVLAYHLPAPDKSALDNLDIFRRFEQVFPAIGAEVNAALLHEPLQAALALLAIFERHLQIVESFPSEGTQTVKQYLQTMVQD